MRVKVVTAQKRRQSNQSLIHSLIQKIIDINDQEQQYKKKVQIQP